MISALTLIVMFVTLSTAWALRKLALMAEPVESTGKINHH